MIKTIIYHKVEDFNKWKKVFDEFSGVRKSAGELSYAVGNFGHDANIVYVVNEWESKEAFDAFLNNPELKKGMQASGATEPPHAFVLNEMESGSL